MKNKKIKKEFLPEVIHEINTSLTYIKGHLELLNFDINEIENIKLKKEINQSIQTISDGLNRISSVVENIKNIDQKK